MKPDPRFLKQSKDFWAHVRMLSQALGYTKKQVRKKNAPKKEPQINVPSVDDIVQAMKEAGLKSDHLVAKGEPTELCKNLIAYFQFRATTLENDVKPNLMDVDDAKALYQRLKAGYKPKLAAPMNKQKGKKKQIAYLTAIINMIFESGTKGYDCDYDPRGLTAITKDGLPVRTLARRVDGAFPCKIDPLAIWEIKEYYYTTTFGSRVADGVYETLLDGMELEELAEHTKINVLHFLFVDSHFTWWVCGRSYLCRIIDMLHMGYVDEVIFGTEVETRLPELVKELTALAEERGIAKRADE